MTQEADLREALEMLVDTVEAGQALHGPATENQIRCALAAAKEVLGPPRAEVESVVHDLEGCPVGTTTTHRIVMIHNGVSRDWNTPWIADLLQDWLRLTEPPQPAQEQRKP